MRKTYGLVVCGGESSRMGMDKSLLVYHGKPQRYHLYEEMQTLCDRVFISCNKKQASAIRSDYEIIVDLDRYEAIGPMAAVLSAFARHPDANLLVIACDYPFLSGFDMSLLLQSFDESHPATAYFNPDTNIFEPLLAVYSADSYPHLIHHFNRKDYSLRSFLTSVHAQKLIPSSSGIITSIDTPESYKVALEQLRFAKVTH